MHTPNMKTLPPFDVKRLLKRLENYYWSPEHPTRYVMPNGEGIGTVAMQDCGAFNLVWAAYPLSTQLQHARAMSKFEMLLQENRQLIFDEPLSTWLTILSKEEFAIWYRSNKLKLTWSSRRAIEDALNALSLLR